MGLAALVPAKITVLGRQLAERWRYQPTTEAEPELYFRPAYYGPSDWIGIKLDRPRVDWDHVAQWLQRSLLAMAPPRLTKLLRMADEF